MKNTKKIKNVKSGFSVVENIPTEKYLTFFIDSQLYAIPTSEVMEIIRMQPITFMPDLPQYVKGVINLRGKIVSLIDMRLKFCKEEKEYGSRTSIIIVECGEMTVGLIVDAVKDVRDVAANQIFDAPKHEKNAGTQANYVRAIASLDKESAMLLDIPKVLTHKHSQAELKSGENDKELKVAVQ